MKLFEYLIERQKHNNEKKRLDIIENDLLRIDGKIRYLLKLIDNSVSQLDINIFHVEIQKERDNKDKLLYLINGKRI